MTSFWSHFMAGVDRVGDDVENRAVHRFGIEHQRRHRAGRLEAELDTGFLGSRFHQFDDVASHFVDVRRLGDRLALFAEREHVHHERGDPLLILFDDVPAFAHVVTAFSAASTSTVPSAIDFGVVLHAHFDQVAAAADALQNVLDVVRERGDRLADGRQTFGLHHRLVVGRVFDRERRLMGDGDHQLEMLLRELVGRALLQDALRRERRVDVDHADDVVAALHRHANRLADAQLQNAFGGVPAVVVAGVAGEHAFVADRRRSRGSSC